MVPQLVNKSPCIYWNPNVHYRVYKGPQLLPRLSQLNPVHALPTDFSVILPPSPRSFKWSLSVRIPKKNSVCKNNIMQTIQFQEI